MIAYLIAGAVLIGSLIGFVAMERKAGADSVRAVLQPKLDACQGEIKKQNDALEAVRKEQLAKQAKATQELASATKRGKVWEDNALRLQAVLSGRKPDGDKSCAGAWAEIRKPK